ncbi:MAG: LPD5 domain-containing protein [Zoogloeaceae bacterium]|jgi:GNAT superfamily N-acetyltransferase|nr:LPD5 domain-containing protein [Zoogloeaceae bacterium]
MSDAFLSLRFPTGVRRFIVNVLPAGEDDVQCIKIAHPSRLYVTNDLIPTHNTTVDTQAETSQPKAANEGEAANIAQAMRSLAQSARTASNENQTVTIATVSEKAAQEAKDKAGLDIAGYTHTADMFAARHILNQHGDAAAEAKRGQIAITGDDIAAIPEAINAPDARVYGVKNNRKQDLVASIKRLPDGTLLVVEEVRTGKRTLALASLRKVPAAKDFGSVARTLLSNAQSDGGDKLIIAPADESASDTPRTDAGGAQPANGANEIEKDYRRVVLRALESIIPKAQRFERSFGKGQWEKYIKDTLIGRHDILRGFVKSPVSGDMAKFKIALNKAKSARDLAGIVEKLNKMIRDSGEESASASSRREAGNPDKTDAPSYSADGQSMAREKPAKLENFGEALPPRFVQHFGELADKDIAALPLSKIWPQEEIDAIADNDMAALAVVIRNRIPAKPRAASKRGKWTEQVKNARALLEEFARLDFDAILARMDGFSYETRGMAVHLRAMRRMPRADWERLAGETTFFPKEKGDENGWFSTHIDGSHQVAKADSPEQAADWLVERMKKAPEAPAAKRERKLTGGDFETRFWRVPTAGRKKYFIQKRGDNQKRVLFEADTLAEARAFLQEHVDDLIAAWENLQEANKKSNVREEEVRSAENRPRVGGDHRNGEDATPEMFDKAFGFRGVEFGKWVSQGKDAKERQGFLNLAYDSLMDLATILGIPSRAISLNGELGLGLGSRGSGKFSAHFEPDTVIINLTKTRGAGSLAHEWFHALDNYLRRQRDDYAPDRDGGYMTHKPEPSVVKWKNRVTGNEARLGVTLKPWGLMDWRPGPDRNPDNWERDDTGVRPEVNEAFAALVKALEASPMRKRVKGLSSYWGRPTELGARSFEQYIIARMEENGYRNDFLANVLSFEQYQERREDADKNYPYHKAEEFAPVKEAFDQLFGTLKTRETDKGTALFSFAAPVSDPETVAGVRDGLDAAIGRKAAGRLLMSRKVVIHASPDSLPDGLASQVSRSRKKVSGLYDPKTGKIHLVAPWIQKGTVASKLGHEGWHMFLDALKHQDGKAHRTMMNRLALISKSKRGDISLWFEKAKARIPDRDKTRGEAVYLNELAAYAIEEYERAPRSLPQAVAKWVQDFIASIRAALMEYGFDPKNLTAADLSAIARRFLRSRGQKTEDRGQTNLLAFPDGAALASSKADPFKPDEYDAREFAQAVDRIFAGEKTRDLLPTWDTPAALRALGAGSVQVQVQRSVLEKANDPDIRGHDVPVDVLRNLPALLADPVAVFDSRTEDNAVLAFVEAKDESGRDVAIAAHMNAKGRGFLEVTKIASVYGRNGAAEFVKWTNEGQLRYHNTGKAARLLHGAGLQLPGANTIKRLSPDSITENDIADAQFSTESTDETVFDWSVGKNTNRAKKMGDTTILYGFNGKSAEIISLRTTGTKRGKGSARRAMEQFLREADAQGIPVNLYASPLDKRTKDFRLQAFYRQLGFVPTGRTINPLGDPEMRREAAKTREQEKAAGAKPKPEQGALFSTEQEEKAQSATSWPAGFPRVTQMTTAPRMLAHPDYRAAKSGDREAAARFVRDIMSGKTQQEKLKTLAEKYPNAIVVPVHAEEAAGRNQIPRKLADYIGQAAGLEVDTDIVQSKRVGRTGQDAMYRLAFRPEFDGPVEKGREYLLVDDVVTGGGTFSELRQHIEKNGGKVADMVSLGAAKFSTNIALSDATRLELERVHGVESLQQFLKEMGLYDGNHQALTESEARILLAAGTLDAARNRILAARQQGKPQTLTGSLQGREAAGEAESAPLFSVADSAQSFRDTERAYGGKAVYDRAKAAGRTKLNFRQWVQVRTPQFKKWFGDWQAARGLQKLEGMKPAKLDSVKPAADQKAVEALFKGFGEVENREDGRAITFPANMAGKILRHKGFDMKRIAGAFDRLFADAVPMTSELEEAREGHKDHTSNTYAYHDYVTKFEHGGKMYYIRFTAQQMKARGDKPGESLVHSSFVSDVSVYQANEKGGVLIQPASGLLTRAHSDASPLDTKLAQWLQKGKEPVSKAIDEETGEPLVVYHGTRKAGFSVFDTDGNGKTAGTGAWFSESILGASTYSGTRTEAKIQDDEDYDADSGNYPVFLNIRTPEVHDFEGKNWDGGELEFFAEDEDGEVLEYFTNREDAEIFAQQQDFPVNIKEEYNAEGDPSTDDMAREARQSGADGVIIENVSDEGPYGQGYGWDNRVYVAFSPNQIKSATGNTGAFSEENDDIQYSVEGEGAPQSPWSVQAPTSATAKAFDNVRYQFQDKFIDLDKIIRAIEKAGGIVRDQFNAYIAETLMHGRIANATKRFQENELAPVLEDMKKNGINIRDMEQFLHARHAAERNKAMAKLHPTQAEIDARLDALKQQIQDIADKGLAADKKRLPALREEQDRLKNTPAWTGSVSDRNRLSGMSDKEAKDIIDAVKKKKGALAYGRIADNIDRIVAVTRAGMQAYGLETSDAINNLASAYRHYVPLMRDMEESELLGGGNSKGFGARGASVRTATGSLRKVENIFANIVRQREDLIARGEKNRVNQALLGLVTDNPNAGMWSVIDPNMPVQAIRAELLRQGSDPKTVNEMVGSMTTTTVDGVTGVARVRINSNIANLENVIPVRVNGKERLIVLSRKNDVTVRLAQALRNEDRAWFPSGKALGAVGAVTRYIAAMATQYNPVFGFTNFTRDVQEAMLNLTNTEISGKQREIMKGIKPALQTIWKTERNRNPSGKWANFYQEFLASGAATGYRDGYANIEDRARQIERELYGVGVKDIKGADDAAFAIRNAKGVKSLLDLLSNFNTTRKRNWVYSAHWKPRRCRPTRKMGMARKARYAFSNPFTIANVGYSMASPLQESFSHPLL